MTITPAEFDCWMRDIFSLPTDLPASVAVGVSGGGDSMALLLLMIQWVAAHAPRIQIHALTVDTACAPNPEPKPNKLPSG